VVSLSTRQHLTKILSCCVCLVLLHPPLLAAEDSTQISNKQLRLEANSADGSFALYSPGGSTPVFRSGIAAEVGHRWLRSGDYPRHDAQATKYQDSLGIGQQIVIANSGLAGSPDLIATLRLYADLPFGMVEVRVLNSSMNSLSVQAIRTLDISGSPPFDLGGPISSTRVLSDSFSEDRPVLEIRDLHGAVDGMHRAVGSQLFYNRKSGMGFLAATLTSRRFLTLLHLRGRNDQQGDFQPEVYTATSTGTTEILREESLKDSDARDQVELSLSLAPGEGMESEQLMFALGSNYHQLLATYGDTIRKLHAPRKVSAPMVGWWSWTAYYFGINEGAALTNANWMATHLKKDGYVYFHLDEGYDYARGEYVTPDASRFPLGMQTFGEQIARLGLRLGVWTAPFEVSDRSWVYQQHKDWLVHNAQNEPIHIGHVVDQLDPLYVLDVTNPEAQNYLRLTYRTLANHWGVRYIKLDFMDDSAIEGHYYKPNTTALEAQQVGLRIIREAVGDDVVLDKDGSPMLNPVGLVDTGRISADTGHSFEVIKEAEPGIAARYYMNHNFFVADPDAFCVSKQVVIDPDWHGRVRPLSLNEAEVSIVLAALAGGMFELGDDLPALGADEDRVALVRNRDLLNMIRLGRSATPIDLMTFAPDDQQPSIFFLQQDRRQSMLAVFNWSDRPTTHQIALSDLGLDAAAPYLATDVLDSGRPVSMISARISIREQAPHSVRLFKIINNKIAAAEPSVAASMPKSVAATHAVLFQAAASEDGPPALAYHWEFDDGVSADGASVSHAFTKAGQHSVSLTVEGLDGLPYQKAYQITVTGETDTRFKPEHNLRFVPSTQDPPF